MDQRQIFLRDVLTVLFKRKLFIALFTVLVVAVVAVGNVVWPPSYESVAKVRLIRGRTTSQTDPTVVRSATGVIMMQLSREDVYSEVDMIYSQQVLENVVRAMNLDRGMGGEPGLARAALEAARNLQFALGLKQRPEAVQEAVEALRKAITVKADDKKYVLEIACRLGDAELARDVLKTLIAEYKQWHLTVFANPDSAKFFDEQVERVTQSLVEAQTALQTFRDEHKIVSLDAEEELLLGQYTEAKRLLVQLAESETAAEALAAQQADEQIIATLSRKTENTVVTELQLRLLELILERNRITESLGPRHPQVVAIQNEIRNAQQRLVNAIETTRDNTDAKIADLEERLRALNTLQARLEDLNRTVRMNADALEYYTQKREESIVADAMKNEGISSIRDVELASLPVNPVSPRKLVNLVLALIAGLVGGVALAFFLEYLDHGLKTPEDIEHFLKLPPLASFFRTSYEQLDPTEAQRLSTMIDAVQSNRPNQCVQVVSSVGREGAGRVALALASARAEDPELRTVLVDFVGDGIGDVPNDQGIVDVLTGQCRLDDVISTIGALHVIGRGAGQCPNYLWGSQRMNTVLADIRQRYDRVIFHVAPLKQSTEGLTLARFTDGVVMVIRADGTRREVVARAVEMLNEARAHIVGAVLTERRQVIPEMVYRRI